MRSLASIAVGTALLIGGCASENVRPDWLTGNSAKYQNTGFMLGRGQASTQEKAADRARGDLAKIFQVWISDESVDSETYTSTAKQGRTQRELESESTRTVVAWTDQIIEGIQIKEFWQDPETQVHYALAVLSRAQTVERLRQQMDRLDKATRGYVEQARNSVDVLARIGAVDRAIAAQKERQLLQDSLTIVDLSGRGSAPKWDIAPLQRELASLLKRMRIRPRVSEDPLGGLKTVLSGGLASAGVMVVGAQQPDYVLEAGLHLFDLGEHDGWQWLRGTLEVRLSEPMGERVRGTKHWTIKVSARQRPVVRRRAMDQVASILRDELRAAIVGFASGR